MSMTGAEMRRSTDKGEPTNRELLDRIERLSRDLEAFMAEHRSDHVVVDAKLGDLQRGAILREERIGQISAKMPELAELHDFRVQVQTLSKVSQWVFGGSLLAAFAAIASLIMSISHTLAR